MGVNLNFDARTVEPNKALDPIPPDWYAVQIVKSEAKPTKDSTPAAPAGYLELTLEVVFGPHKGRKLFDRLNLQNANAQTVEIAKGTLSAICRATNVIQLTNTDQLHGKPLLAKVTVRPAQGQYQATNEVKGYKGMEDGPSNALGAGIGGNTAGVPSWAQGNAPAPATAAPQNSPAQSFAPSPQQAAPVATTPANPASTAAPAAGGFSFGGNPAGLAPATGSPAAEEVPDWARSAQA